MTDLNKLIEDYRRAGYPSFLAVSTACQDVLIAKIAASSLRANITVKGGVLMHSLSGSGRRATRDFDLDFMRYPLSEKALDRFFAILSAVDDGVSISRVGEIEELSQQDYRGKRINVIIGDGKRSITTKLDIGVQADMDIAQEEFYFDVSGHEESISLLANSKEQVFGEKLVSLLKWGVASTRFKDIHDLYYLGHRSDFDRERLEEYLGKWVYGSNAAWLPMTDAVGIGESLSAILNDGIYRQGFASSKDKWLDVNDDESIDWLISYFSETYQA
jgi:hypothetical protein